MVVNSTNSDFAIMCDNDIAAILQNFSEESILNILDSILKGDGIAQSLVYGQGYVLSNMVKTYEDNYIIAQSQYPSCSNELRMLRNNVYHAIMNRLCDHYSLSYIDDGSDPFTLASHMYEFLVSDFSVIMINFLTRYIFKEVNNLYDMLKVLSETGNAVIIHTTNPDGSSASKLDTVLDNLKVVITNMLGMDIPLEAIINDTYCNERVSLFLNSHISDNGDFFKNKVGSFIKSHLPLIITNIRLSIKQNGMDSLADRINNYLET